MKTYIFLFTLVFSIFSIGQTKQEYLQKNRHDLHKKTFQFPQKGFKILGFGAYHGSVKTEDTELNLLSSLHRSQTISYYLPETDYSIGHYFDQFLQTGDTILLKVLIIHYGTNVPQERSISMYKKWKRLKEMNDELPKNKKMKVVGIDILTTYKYPSKHLIDLLDRKLIQSEALTELQQMVKLDTTDYSPRYNSYAKGVLKRFVADVETKSETYQKAVKDKASWDHIIKNIKVTFTDFSRLREPTIYQNYLDLSERHDFKNKAQYLRMGFSHLEKSREGEKGYPYFFTRLIENKIYPKEEVIAVIGYLTNSEVLWDELYDEQGEYEGFTTEAGFGIGDYEKEYFRGIDNLKKTKISDQTLFRLNAENTPYSGHMPDLIDVIMTESKSNSEAVKGMSTTDFVDYAILISDSRASKPIFEMKD
ncbi:hypothetical protein [Kordia sp.]|uniref:hypothetical protein n=1 Tax=Kordia sp. TaxID=1965332 RepID=UPI0025C6259F|nr:hypothetical protein [Kordia sp.]MCH2195040.1 hypothetical protein [Kordia sp.]